MRDNSYIFKIFDHYCDYLTKITVRMSLMDQSHKKISNNLLNFDNQLMLIRIVRLFPQCEEITVIDGIYNYQLIPIDTEHDRTIFGAAVECIEYAETNGSLEIINFDLSERLIDGRLGLLQQFQARLQAMVPAWTCEQNK